MICTQADRPQDVIECDCSRCQTQCQHANAYRRYPRCFGGLGLCNNLSENIKAAQPTANKLNGSHTETVTITETGAIWILSYLPQLEKG